MDFSLPLRNKDLVWKCDNMNVVNILARGSMKLQFVAKEIFLIKNERNIRISAVWISGNMNKRADIISKIPLPFDWVVNQQVFDYIDSVWGPFTCDTFADFSSSKCKKFYSKFWSLQSYGADAFNFDWGSDKNWVAPPINLVGNAISHMKECRAYGALVVPRWESSYFWPMLCRDDGTFAEFILEFKEYSSSMLFFPRRKYQFREAQS